MKYSSKYLQNCFSTIAIASIFTIIPAAINSNISYDESFNSSKLVHFLTKNFSTKASNAAEGTPTNVMVVIWDDYGAVSSNAYQDIWNGDRYATTPHIDSICSQGVRFENAWTNPTCSPTRANILTGRYSFRNGVGMPTLNDENEINPDEVTIPRLLNNRAPQYVHANVGKWHLGASAALSGDNAPNFMGWDFFAGPVDNTMTSPDIDFYFNWPRTVNGVTNNTTVYSTTQHTNDAIAFLNNRPANSPFFLWEAYFTPHIPLHVPPANLQDHENLTIDSPPIDLFEAMIEAGDKEFGRLMATLPDDDQDGLPDDTIIFLLGDNGTQGGRGVMPEPYESNGTPGKGRLSTHGVRVPLCVAGTGVSGGRSIADFVQATDILATSFDMIGVSSSGTAKPLDSISFAHLLRNEPGTSRQYLFAEAFDEFEPFPINDVGLFIRSKKLKYKQILNPSTNQMQEFCFFSQDTNETTRIAKKFCEQEKVQLLELVCTDPNSPWLDMGVCPVGSSPSRRRNRNRRELPVKERKQRKSAPANNGVSD